MYMYKVCSTRDHMFIYHMNIYVFRCAGMGWLLLVESMKL